MPRMLSKTPKKSAGGNSADNNCTPVLNKGLAWYYVLGLCAASMAMLHFAFAPFGAWYLAYVALLPWAVAVSFARSTKTAVLLGWFCGAVYWAASVYWLILPTGVGYAAVAVYLSLYWLAGSYIVRRCVGGGQWMWFWLPVVFVTAEFIRAHVISFEWFFLSQTQYENLRLIQISDVTGQYGVSFFVVMVNGLLLDAIVWYLRRGAKRKLVVGGCVTAVSLAGMLIYGGYRMNQHTTARGPVVGIVQPAVPISLQGSGIGSDKILDVQLRMSMGLFGKDCDVVLWSETMLPSGMNKEVLNVRVSQLTDAEVLSLAAGIWDKRTTRQYSVGDLRIFLGRILGNVTNAQASARGCRYFLTKYLTAGQYEALSEEKINRLSKMLLGSSAEKLSPVQRRLAAGIFVIGANLDKYSADDYKKILQDDPAAYAAVINSTDKKRLLYQCRRTIGNVSLNVVDPELVVLRVAVEVVRACSITLGCDIIAGGSTLHPNPRPIERYDQWMMCNSVILFSPAGREQLYSKIHLVPFSEYVIGKYSCKPLYDLCRSFVPEEMPQLYPGKDFTRFYISDANGSWQLATPVCFEGTFSRICRRITNTGTKSNLVLANVSNDGWFVWPVGKDRHVATTEHSQHFVHYIFRAIENRLPVVRAVNTGISGYIDSNGRVEYLPGGMGDLNDSVMLPASAAVPTQVDSRLSIYTRYGDFFAMSVAAVAIFGILWYFSRRSLTRQKA